MYNRYCLISSPMCSSAKSVGRSAFKVGMLGARESRPLCSSCRRPSLNALILRWLIGSVELLLMRGVVSGWLACEGWPAAG